MIFSNSKRVFMDYASATPMLKEVYGSMKKYWSNHFYNPSAIYSEGTKVKEDLEDIRAKIALLIGASKKDVVFTSGGTESDNLAILGAFEEYRQQFPHIKPHLIISNVEHPAVMESAIEVERRGGEVSIAKVNEKGFVSPEEIRNLLKKETFLVSVMLANNEIGTTQPISKIGRHVVEYRKDKDVSWPLLHTDASQAFNYLPINVGGLNVDLLTLDGSKVYGPKGVGCLVVRPGVSIRQIIVGGGQERGIRSGTENVPLIIGFGKALELAERDREGESKRLRLLQEYFIRSIKNNVSTAIINTPLENTLPNIISVSVPGTSSEMMLLFMDQAGVMVSIGSACTSTTKREGSYVISAIGRDDLAQSTLRFSFGKFTSKSEVDRAIKVFREASIRGKIRF